MEKRESLLLILSTAIISGVSIFLNKFAVKGMDSDIFTFSKNIIVALFMFSVILFFSKLREFKMLEKRDWMKLIAVGFIGGSIPFILYFKGLQMTTAASASLIHKSMFVLVMILAISLLKEKLNKKVIAAAILLMIGNYLLIRPNFSFNAGDMLILCATGLWAAENIISKKILRELSGNIVAFGRMFFGSLFIFSYLVFAGKAGLLFSLTGQQASWVLLTAGMLALYVITWYNGLKHIDVSLATAILLLGSPITALMNYAAGAQVGISQAIGILTLVLGIVAFMNSTEKFCIKELKKAWSQKIKD